MLIAILLQFCTLYAFELEVIELNAYSLSYVDEDKHKVPELNEFPDGMTYLVTGQGEPYKGWKKAESPVQNETFMMGTHH